MNEGGTRLRLMTYNIHGCIGRAGRYDEERILRVIEEADADIVALQEVYDEEPEDRCFLAKLEQSPYPEMVYGITLTHRSRGYYGNVLLSRLPLRQVDKLDISVKPYEPRGAIRVQAELDGKLLDLTATHFGLRREERIQQLAMLEKEWQRGGGKRSERDRIFCLMGDLNEWQPRGAILRRLNGMFGRSPYVGTFPAQLPGFALDRVYVRPREVVQRWAALRTGLARGASDHLPLVADLRV